MDTNDITTRRQYRRQLLQGVYDITKGAPTHYVGLVSLGANLGIPEDEVRLAWSNLLQQGLLKSAGIGRELRVFITSRGVGEAEKLATEHTQTKEVQAMNDIRVFISHSAKDATIIKALVECIEACVEVPDNGIRCTSIPGYKLAPGDIADEALRENLEQCSVVIGFLTEESLRSGYVVMELGAAWGLKKTTCALLAPSIEFKSMPGPLGRLHAVKADSSHDVAAVMEVIAEKTGWVPRNRARFMSAVNTFVTLANSHP